MRITVDVRPSFDNEIRFYDACMAVAKALTKLAKQSLEDGDCDQFRGTRHVIHEDNDDHEEIGAIVISDIDYASRL